MDNLTHSLVGILADRVLPDPVARAAEKGTIPGMRGHPGPAVHPIPPAPGSPADSELAAAARRSHRPLFWLLLISANLPDIDSVAKFFTDPLTSLGLHRGITHSYIFAPLLAFLPAAVIYIVSRRKDFPRLWLFSFVGVCIHIFTDLITAYGTQILYPLSETRYSLDWMFIIDPFFTGMLLVMLIAGKFIPRWKRTLGFVTLGLTVFYLGAEYRMNALALEKFRTELQGLEITPHSVAALPQPLSLTNWVGLAMTDSAAVRIFLSLFDADAAAEPEHFPLPDDPVVRNALASPHVREYLEFARFPVVTASMEADFHIVEFRDLQFSVDPGIVRAVGLGERDIPFVLKLVYDRSLLLIDVQFNDRPVPLNR